MVVVFGFVLNYVQALLKFDEPGVDVEDVFCRTFTFDYDYYGEMRSLELKPGGADTMVTNANRGEYVAKYCQHVLVDSVKAQFEPFRRGFMTLFTGHALELFSPEELEVLWEQAKAEKDTSPSS